MPFSCEKIIQKASKSKVKQCEGEYERYTVEKREKNVNEKE